MASPKNFLFFIAEVIAPAICFTPDTIEDESRGLEKIAYEHFSHSRTRSPSSFLCTTFALERQSLARSPILSPDEIQRIQPRAQQQGMQ
jgi:hypothetical protein